MAEPTILAVPVEEGHRITFVERIFELIGDDGQQIGGVTSGGTTLVLKFGDHSATIDLIALYKKWVRSFDPVAAEELDNAEQRELH